MNKNPLLLPASIIIAGIIIAGAVMYKPTARPAVIGETAEKKLDYVELAGTLGMDTKAFKTCVDTHQFKDAIAKDAADGESAGVNSTPTTLVNGQKIVGAVPYAQYKTAIDAELEKGPVTVTIFGDYQCPYCGQAYQISEKQLRTEYVDTGKATMVFKNFPLWNIHPAAEPAAEAAECARAQGKFWQYHDALFDDQDRLPIP